MAEIQFMKLVEAVDSGDIQSDDDGVPPRQALYVRFGSARVEGVESKEYELCDGSRLVIDLKNGKVVGLEIVG